MNKINRERTIWLAAIIALLLGIGIAFAMRKPTVTARTLAANKPQDRVIFDISAKKAFTSRTGDSARQLVIGVPHIEEVRISSDKPNKVVKIISTNEFKKLWSRGSNSFSMDPPNAVLSANNLPPTIISLTSSQVDSNAILYTFKILRGSISPNAVLTHITLTVDSIVI